MEKINIKKIDIGILIQKISKILYGFIFIVLVSIAGLITVSSFKIPGNYKLYSVQSGSMEPAIKKGAIVVVKPESNYQKGDVITVVEPANRKVSLTHRIFEVNDKDGKISYITKGDANKTPDTEKRPKENVVGKVIFSLPFIGYPIGFAKTRDGLIVLIIIPATLVVYSELQNLKNEAKRLLQVRKEKKNV